MFKSGPGQCFRSRSCNFSKTGTLSFWISTCDRCQCPQLWNWGKRLFFNDSTRRSSKAPRSKQYVHAAPPEHRQHVTYCRARTKVPADGCVSWFPVPKLKSRGRAADMLQTVLTHGCVVLYLRWLPGGGACSLQHECLCMWSGLRLGTLLPPYCSGGSGPAAAAVAALLVYVCVRAQECPDHGLFTKQPFACFPPDDMLTRLLQEKAKMVLKKKKKTQAKNDSILLFCIKMIQKLIRSHQQEHYPSVLSLLLCVYFKH